MACFPQTHTNAHTHTHTHKNTDTYTHTNTHKTKNSNTNSHMKNSKIDRYINSQQVTTHMQGCEQHYDKSCHTPNISRGNMKNTYSAIQTYCANTTNPNPGNNITIHPPKTVPMTTMYIYHPKHDTHTRKQTKNTNTDSHM